MIQVTLHLCMPRGTCKGSRGTVLLTLNLHVRSWVVSLTLRPLYPEKAAIDLRVDRQQSLSGRFFFF